MSLEHSSYTVIFEYTLAGQRLRQCQETHSDDFLIEEIQLMSILVVVNFLFLVLP